MPLTAAQLQDAIAAEAGAWGNVQGRAVLGGHGFTVDGRLFALLAEPGLLLKLAPESAVENHPGGAATSVAAPLPGFSDWVALPPASWDDLGAVLAMVRASFDHVGAAARAAPTDRTPRRFRKRQY
jgi:TfoX/Sxy family transcriptional regulator of competence genes